MSSSQVDTGIDFARKKENTAKKPFLKLRKRIFIIFILFTLIGVVFIGIASVYIVKSSIRKESEEKLAITVKGYANSLDGLFNQMETTVRLIVKILPQIFDFTSLDKDSSVVIEKVEKSVAPFLERSFSGMENMRAVYFYANPDYFGFHYNVSFEMLQEGTSKRLRVLSPQGYNPVNPDMQWFYAPLEKKQPVWAVPFFWDLFQSDFISFNMPLILQDKTVGVVGLFLEFNKLVQAIESMPLPPKSAEIVNKAAVSFLLDSQNRVILHPLLAKGTLLQNLIQNSVEKNVAFFSKTDADKGTVTCYSVLQNGWKFGVEVLEKELYKSTAYAIMLLCTIVSVFMVISFLLTVYFTHTLSRPIEELIAIVQDFRNGNLSSRYVTKRNDEIGIFANLFNQIADSFEERLETIKKQKDDITAFNEELEAMNIQLEESYNRAESLASGLQKTISLSSKASLKSFQSQHSFLREALDTVLALIPNADFGTVFILNHDDFSMVSFVGHRFSRYYQFSKEQVLFHDEPFLIDNAYGLPEITPGCMQTLPNTYLPERKPTRSTLGTFLRAGKEVLGLITLDIAKERSFTFTDQEISILNSFSNIASSFLALRTFVRKSESFQKEIILAIIKILELYDPYTQGHSENVALLASAMAEEIGMNDEEAKKVYWVGLVHDIGKILVPAEVLKKKGKLTHEEYFLIQKHPQWGAEVLHSSNELRDVSDFVLFHHERWDGKGYPIGLKEEEIPSISRIIAIADSLDAMTSDRPYRKGIPIEDAFLELEKCSGTQFDPSYIDRIVHQPACREKIKSILKKKD